MTPQEKPPKNAESWGAANNPVTDVRISSDATVVVLTGDVFLMSAEALHTTLRQIVAEGRPQKLVLDVRGVSSMDSAGIGALMTVTRRVSSYGGKLVLFGLSRRLRDVFEATKLDKLFTIRETEDEARQV